MNVRVNMFAGVAMTLASAGALAQNSTVTIYGHMDAAVTWLRTGTGTSLPGGGTPVAPSTILKRLDSGVGPGTRLGFRGREDLGGGISANFIIESGFAVDTGGFQQGGLAFGRQALVGLQGANWSVSAGRQYSPLNLALGSVDAMGTAYWGSSYSSAGFGIYGGLGETGGGGFAGGAARIDNSVLVTANGDGFTGRFMVGAGNENERGTGRYLGPQLQYTAGPLMVTGAVARFRQGAGALQPNVAPKWRSEAVIGATYDFGSFKLSGGYYQLDGQNTTTGLSAAATVGAVGSSPYAHSWDKLGMAFIGASVPWGQNRVTVAYTNFRYDYATGPNGKAFVLGAVYEYQLSKRSAIYLSTAMVNNDARSRTPLAATISAVSPNGFGSDPRAVSLGIRHQF